MPAIRSAFLRVARRERRGTLSAATVQIPEKKISGVPLDWPAHVGGVHCVWNSPAARLPDANSKFVEDLQSGGTKLSTPPEQNNAGTSISLEMTVRVRAHLLRLLVSSKIRRIPSITKPFLQPREDRYIPGRPQIVECR